MKVGTIIIIIIIDSVNKINLHGMKFFHFDWNSRKCLFPLDQAVATRKLQFILCLLDGLLLSIYYNNMHVPYKFRYYFLFGHFIIFTKLINKFDLKS